MIRVEESSSRLILTLDRPDKANALTAEMLEALASAVLQTQARAIVLTGTGKVFSAGADLDAAKAGLATSPLWENLSGAIANSNAFTIAALNGTLAGGAFGMALACDMRIAVPDAKFFYPVMKLGYLPQPSDPKRLIDLVGPAGTKRLLMAGDKITAETALNIGLIDEVVDGQALMDRAMALTEAACTAKEGHVANIKNMTRL